jgi:hypothetical protein
MWQLVLRPIISATLDRFKLLSAQSISAHFLWCRLIFSSRQNVCKYRICTDDKSSSFHSDGRVEVNLSPCLSNYHAMKTYDGMEIQLNAFLTAALKGGEIWIAFIHWCLNTGSNTSRILSVYGSERSFTILTFYPRGKIPPLSVNWRLGGPYMWWKNNSAALKLNSGQPLYWPPCELSMTTN